jgi:hypothetical protein
MTAEVAAEAPKKLNSTMKRGLGMSKSSPVIAAACNLRQYRPQKKTQTASGPSFDLGEIDRLGGNGFWRQRLAEQKFAEDQIKEAERLREEKLKEEQRVRRLADRDARRRKQLEEEQKQRQLQKEKERLAKEAEEEQRRKKLEKERKLREEEERERLARMPKPCWACNGTGRCQKCVDSPIRGVIFTMFLVPNVMNEHKYAGMDFGRMMQGCENCGGTKHNLLGELKPGTGDCPVCNGYGKIWPDIARQPYKRKLGRRGSSDALMDAEGPYHTEGDGDNAMFREF